ncbi:transglutaminase-like domain-containing protein [Chloroflexota bacterium]
MRKIIVLSILSLLLLFPMAFGGACQQQPEPTPTAPAPAPTPAPTPSPLPPAIDEPKLSEDEVCVLIWNKIPSQLPGGYSKNDLLKETRMTKYEGDGQWLFSVLGEVRKEGTLVTEVVRTEDYWVDRESCEVTSYGLHLTAMYYENTKTIDIDVEKQNEKVITETSDTPILRKEIKLNWIKVGTYGSYKYYTEGSIENISKIPVARLLIEFFFFDEDGNLLKTEKYKITPDSIPAGELGKFKYDFILSGKHLYSYNYRFILETSEVFEYLEGSGEEEPVFFYEMDLEEATAEIITPSGFFSTYVMSLNKQVRDTTMSVLSDAPEGVNINADVWKIWKIHNWVANNIKYVSDPLGFEYMTYPYETLDSKAGDCDDYAVLLASMYETSGLDAMIAFVDMNADKEVEHVACLVYYPQGSESFLEDEKIIIDELEISYPAGERHLKYIIGTDNIMPYKTSDIYGEYEEGIWIIADPLVAMDTDIVGYIIFEPYVILAVDDVGE